MNELKAQHQRERGEPIVTNRPRTRGELQRQGVPFPDRLRGPGEQKTSGARQARLSPQASGNGNGSGGGGGRNSVRWENNPIRSADKAVSAVGTLEAEFLVAIAMLILLMFSSSASFSDKMMSTMKRGALTCILFFILSLVSGAGPNAAKVCKALGALIVVGILVTSPMSKVITDLDNLIKNAWTGTSESGGTGSGNASGASSSTGTQGATSNPATKTLTPNAISSIIHAGIGTPAYNAFTAELRAFKSGDVWKVPVDAVDAIEQTGWHAVTSIGSKLKGLLHGLGL